MQQKRGESARAEQRTVLYKSDYYPPQSYICESRRDEEEGGELDSQEEASPEEIKSREVVLGYRERESWTSASVVSKPELRTLSL